VEAAEIVAEAYHLQIRFQVEVVRIQMEAGLEAVCQGVYQAAYQVVLRFSINKLEW
jgi:hypothetical protein